MISDFYAVGKLAAAIVFFFISGFFFLRAFYENFSGKGKFELFILSALFGILINLLIGFLLGIFGSFTVKSILIANIAFILITELLFFLKYKKI